MTSNDVQGDDEFRSYITDFESYLHNIGSEVRKASPDGALSEAMTSSVETYEHSEEGGTWQPRDYRNTDDDTNHAHHHEDERYYENQIVQNTDSHDGQEAEYNYQQQQQAYTTDDSGDTVSRSDDEQNEYQINEPVDQTEVIGTQQPIDEVQQDDVIDPAVQQTGINNDHQVYDNDDDNDDYEEAVRYQRHNPEIDQQPVESEYGYQGQSHYTSEQSHHHHQHEQQQQQQQQLQQQLDGEEQRYNALEDDLQDHRYDETVHSYDRKQPFDGHENDYEFQDRQEVGETGGQTNYESQETTDVYQDGVEQSFSEAGLVQHYDASTAYDDAAAADHDAHEEDRFYTEHNAPETESVDRLATRDEDAADTACYNQQYFEENQLQSADEPKQVKFLIESDNQHNLHDVRQSTWQEHEQEGQQSPEADHRHTAGYDNDDEQNQSDEHPGAERGRIKVLLAQWRQIEQQMSKASGSTSKRDSHVRSRSCGPTRRRNVVANIYENKCHDDIATEINSNGRRSRWPEEDEEEENYTANRAAILAKFENLEAQAHKTSVVTTKKKEYKWSVKEPTTLGRPVGLRLTS